jgi:hypothetical protein
MKGPQQTIMNILTVDNNDAIDAAIVGMLKKL